MIEVPCLDKIVDNYKRGVKDPRLTILGLYGEQLQGQPEMVHKWTYSKTCIKSVFARFPFEFKIKEPVYHLKQRDMRAEGIKNG